MKHNELMLNMSMEFDITDELDQSYMKYIVDNDIPTDQWLDVDKCNVCEEVDHEFHDTTEMIGAGVGVICNSCLRDL
jgi:hypothetical protein